MNDSLKEMRAFAAPAGIVYYKSPSTNHKLKKFWLSDGWSQFLTGYKDLLDEDGNVSITISPFRAVFVLEAEKNCH